MQRVSRVVARGSALRPSPRLWARAASTSAGRPNASHESHDSNGASSESQRSRNSNSGRFFRAGAVGLGALAFAAFVSSPLSAQAKQPSKKEQEFSLDEVKKHNSKETGIWVTFKDGVYDVTDFVDIHPGWYLTSDSIRWIISLVFYCIHCGICFGTTRRPGSAALLRVSGTLKSRSFTPPHWLPLQPCAFLVPSIDRFIAENLLIRRIFGIFFVGLVADVILSPYFAIARFE